jgi:hypothetical protein
MPRGARQPGRIALALAGLAALASAGSARAQALSASAQVQYVGGSLSSTDATGRITRTAYWGMPQTYRLGLDKQLFPHLVLQASGLYEWNPFESQTEGIWSETQTNRWMVTAQAVLGPRILNVTPYYTMRQESANARTAGLPPQASPTLVSESFGAYLGWSPAEMPLFSLKYERAYRYDTLRVVSDLVTDSVTFSANYLEVQNLALRYGLRWSGVQDRLRGVESTDFDQAAQVTWSGSYFERRLTGSVSYTLGLRSSTVRVTGSGGTVSLQKFPVAGLSLVEAFPATPERDTLLPNPALIEGDLATGAGLNIGFAPSLAGDVAYRDMGVQFPDRLTAVNQLRVWVDKALPPQVWTAYAWTAFTSDDNVEWTQVPVTGPVVFDPFQNYFEIPIAQVQARYLKVLTKPLPVAATVDRQYADILVTEVQVFLVTPAGSAPQKFSDATGTFNGSARVLLVRDWNLAYDVSLNFIQQNQLQPRSWSVTNGFGASRQLVAAVGVAARIERTDFNSGQGHEAQSRLSAQLTWNPLSALGMGVTYSGQYGEQLYGDTIANALNGVIRVDLYEGVSLSFSQTLSNARAADGRVTDGLTSSAGLTLVPLQALSLNATWSLNANESGGAGRPSVTERGSQLVASVTFAPVQAFYVSGGVTYSKSLTQGKSQALTNVAAGFSPFPGGQLQVSVGYNEYLDSSGQALTRLVGPGVRWNFRPGWYVEGTYTWTETTQPALATYGNNVSAKLFARLF